MLDAHPDLAAEIDEFLVEQDRLHLLAEPLRPLAESAGLTEPDDATAPLGPSGSADPGPDTLDGDGATPHRPGGRVPYFGDYELRREVGRGGMGVVYEARQVSLNRVVALKMLLAGALAGEDDRRRFRAEAEAVAALDHPNIVPIYEVGSHRGDSYFSMKAIDGGTLASRLDEFAGHPREAARVVATVARAVHHAHQRGVLHRDLKPSNVLLDENGEPHVTDFGLARRVDGGGDLTQTGAILGTPSYMAPEQATGRRGAITTATDVHGLGAILYALLAGKPPFGGDSVLETLDEVRGQPPKPLGPGIDRDLGTICRKCLEKEPAARCASALDVAEDLERWLRGEPIAARPAGRAERLWRWCRRHRVALITTLLIASSLVTGTVMSVRQARRARRAEAAAVGQRDRARKSVDDMYTQVAEKWLSQDPDLDPLQREFLLKALAYYEEFSREGAPSASELEEKASAEQRVGDIQRKLGALDEAERAYRSAVAIQGELRDRSPRSPFDRTRLAGGLTGLGELLRAEGRTDEAERVMRNALELNEAVAAEFPDVPRYRTYLARSYTRLALLFRETGRWKAAEEADTRSIALLEALAAEGPEDAEDRGALASSYANLGVLLSQTGRATEAEQVWGRVVRLYEALLPESPKDGAVRSGLALGNNNLGVLLYGEGRLEEAAEALGRAAELQEGLAADSPGAPQYLKGVADSRSNLALVLLALKRPEEAEEAFRRAIKHYEALATRWPDVRDHRSGLGAALNNLAVLLQERGEARESADLYRLAIEQQGAASRANPRNPTYLAFLRNHFDGLSQSLLQLGDHAGAAEASEELARISPRGLPDLLLAATRIAQCRRRAESDPGLSPSRRRDAARAHLERSRELCEKAALAAKDDPDALNNVSWFLATCPEPDLRDPARAVELARKAVERAPQNGECWNTKGAAEYRAGHWDEAISALSRSMELSSGGSPADWIFLAMTHRRKGNDGEARSWFAKASAWMDRNRSTDEDLIRLRDEAAALLGPSDGDRAMPAGPDAFAR